MSQDKIESRRALDCRSSIRSAIPIFRFMMKQGVTMANSSSNRGFYLSEYKSSGSRTLSAIVGVSILAMLLITISTMMLQCNVSNHSFVNTTSVSSIGIEDCDNVVTVSHVCLAQDISRYAYPIVEHRNELGGWFWVLLGVFFIVACVIVYNQQNK